jgi:hypothetical protein
VAAVLGFSGVAGATIHQVVPFGGGGFTVSLSASPTVLASGHATTLTATANADVGATPYYLSIYDQTAGIELAICKSGTTCVVAGNESKVTTQDFQAFVGDAPPSNGPPSLVLAQSQVVDVSWVYRVRPFPNPIPGIR